MKNIRVSYAFAYYSNPIVSQGFTDIKAGDGWKSQGFEITPDHKFIFIEPVTGINNEPMSCNVYFKNTFFHKLTNLLTGQPLARLPHISIKSRKRFRLDRIHSVTSSDGYDDSTHSFSEIPNLLMPKKLDQPSDTKEILAQINAQLFPNVLGLWTCNDGGAFVVTNKDCSRYRALGSNQWCDWNNNPSYLRQYNEYLEVVIPETLGSLAEAQRILTTFLSKELN